MQCYGQIFFKSIMEESKTGIESQGNPSKLVTVWIIPSDCPGFLLHITAIFCKFVVRCGGTYKNKKISEETRKRIPPLIFFFGNTSGKYKYLQLIWYNQVLLAFGHYKSLEYYYWIIHWISIFKKLKDLD